MLAGTVDWPEQTAARIVPRACGMAARSSVCCSARLRVGRRRRRWWLGERRLSYAELQQQATQLAARLLALGLAPRDRVVMQLPNIAGVRGRVLRPGAHRRHSGDGAARAPACRGAALPERLRRHGLCHRRPHRRLRLPRHGRSSCAPMRPALRHVIVVGEPRPGQLAYAELMRDGDFRSARACRWTRPRWARCCCPAAPPRCRS